ncbi:hypothetical protein [Ekhidna sp. To15]|uniref:hypothetical protein n=1 Tax=Ekhidna sp. To15 TaxID=3395267 RepID=UPI003F521054
MIRIIQSMVSRWSRIDQLIRLKSTGAPREFAKRLEISSSTLYEHLNTMKKVFGAPIKYCRNSRSYIYEYEGKMEFGFKKKKGYLELITPVQSEQRDLTCSQ